MSPAESVPATENDCINLACPYCTSPMAPPGFTPWPLEPRLISSDCEGCGRTVTLPSTWLTGSPVPVQR